MSTKQSPNQAPSRRGPRADAGAARGQILLAAQGVFAERGFSKASLQQIAERAGVDKKLIHYYFGSKDELFLALFSDLFRQLGFAEELAKPFAQRGFDGITYVTKILQTIEHSEVAPVLLALLRSLGTHEPSRLLFIKFLENGVLAPLAVVAAGDDARLRTLLAGSQINGLVTVRYILQIEPLASLPIPEVAKLVGPTIDRYLTA